MISRVQAISFTVFVYRRHDNGRWHRDILCIPTTEERYILRKRKTDKRKDHSPINNQLLLSRFLVVRRQRGCRDLRGGTSWSPSSPGPSSISPCSGCIIINSANQLLGSQLSNSCKRRRACPSPLMTARQRSCKPAKDPTFPRENYETETDQEHQNNDNGYLNNLISRKRSGMMPECVPKWLYRITRLMLARHFRGYAQRCRCALGWRMHDPARTPALVRWRMVCGR